MKINEVPVVVVVFNREDLARKMLERLEQIRPKKLFVISDGPRSHVEGEAQKVEKVRELFEHIFWDCDVQRCYAEENMGCDRRIPTGLDWVFEQVEEAIVLEDDCLPTVDFFRYAVELLDYYRYEERVMMIAGSNQMTKYQMPYSFCFTARVYNWGWATWRRAWRKFDGSQEQWEQIQRDGTLTRIYSEKNTQYLKREFNHYFSQGLCPWDYRWWISCLSQEGLCAVPKVNLISNEGFGADATHTHDRGDYKGETATLTFPLQYPPIVERDCRFDQYDRDLNPPSVVEKAFRKMKGMLIK